MNQICEAMVQPATTHADTTRTKQVTQTAEQFKTYNEENSEQ